MKLCLAGTYSRDFLMQEISRSKYLLESFWYFQDWQKPLLRKADLFLVDSGAFTFMNSVVGEVDWNAYLMRYIRFLKENDVEYFFELDVDSILGYDAVKAMRSRLEKEVGKPSIPVWHVNRGKDEFVRMCEEYDYVAFGGILTDGIPTKTLTRYLPWFVRTAHEHGTRIHGLGFTSVKELPRVHFDSVDSTSWLSGSRFGHVYRFTGHTIKQYAPPEGFKTVHYRTVDLNNLREWIKFQQYADRHF